MAKVSQRAIDWLNEYLLDFNGTKAALRIGVPEHLAKRQASRWLNDERVQELLRAKIAERAAKAEWKRADVLQRLKEFAVSASSEALRLAALVKYGEAIGTLGRVRIDVEHSGSVALTGDAKAALLAKLERVVTQSEARVLQAPPAPPAN